MKLKKNLPSDAYFDVTALPLNATTQGGVLNSKSMRQFE
jgi:hypothetical protein